MENFLNKEKIFSMIKWSYEEKSDPISNRNCSEKKVPEKMFKALNKFQPKQKIFWAQRKIFQIMKNILSKQLNVKKTKIKMLYALRKADTNRNTDIFYFLFF